MSVPFTSSNGDIAWGKNATAVHSGDDEFRDLSSVATFTQVTPSGSATWTDGGDVISVMCSAQTSTHMCALLKAITISVGGYIETAVRATSIAGNGIVGLVFTDGTTNSANNAHVRFNPSDGSIAWGAGTLNGATTTSSFAMDSWIMCPWLFLRLKWVSANTFLASMSIDGVTFESFSATNFSKTMTPTQMGIFATNWGNSSKMLGTFEYLRCSG